MKPRFDDPATREAFRERLAGLAEGSHRKSYYPELQQRLSELERFRALLDHSTEAIFLAEVPGGALLDVNGSACQQLGLPREALLGGALEARLAPAHRERLRALLAREDAGEVRETLAAALTRADGSRFPAELGVTLVRLEGHAVAVIVARDVTERQQMQARLALADRLVSLGTVAAGVAHEVNNPLSYVLGNLEYVESKLEEIRAIAGAAVAGAVRPRLDECLADAQAALGDVRAGADRVQRIVRDLKVFSRAEADECEPVDLRPLLDIAASMTANDIRHRARLEKRYQEIPLVRANDGRLTQLFINLLVNAAQAIPDGAAERNEIRISTWTERGDAMVEVRDTGCGIAPEHLPRIFDPFFTTKPAGLGTGLGLAICHGIVTALGGSLEVESAPGAGTRMRLRLPPSRREAPGGLAAGPGGAAEARRLRVLVIDDDPLCLKAVERMVAQAHEVRPCSRARAGLERLEAGERFDAILCDLMMPDLGGVDFHEKLAARFPDQAARMVVLTGGAFSERGQAFLREGRVPFLEKPFSAAALLDAISAAAARAP
ncbi:ATP-binding protein [Anaeromyxobacter paludicola]|uniref:histidine kinase n=1 Tax=Anaeromyxobacter paludicola TaxID=2918171 RepID=A0ABN6NBT3_9BACT|nr:ATP-binding protein [Anaeromyxobacter paludicola]BDG09569.1 hypothetical protein AMPC_26820 [Anaeromyxobacter paludicola]